MSFAPEAFGKFFLVDKIATGGMAEIFKAKSFGHSGFENLIVIKRILSHLSENEDFVEMFVDEAKVSVALQHANIVRVYDFGKVLDNYFIAMECVDGKDVRAILRQLGRKQRYMPIEFALYIAHEACKGLAYAHEKTDLRGHPYGIVHRDMSPSNVLISYEGDVKIADFGIAKAEQNTYTTADGVLKGKFEYMSPEQARGESLDARSDLFSVGIMLYEMLTGRRLFKGESDLATLEAIKRADVKPPSDATPRVPEHIDQLVLKALAADLDDRFASAAEMQQAIRRVLPQPPDELHRDLAVWLRDQFRDEMAQELTRLEQGSALAAAWRDQAPEQAWDGNTNTATLHRDTNPQAATPTDRRRGALSIIVALLLFLIVGAAGALGYAYLAGPSAPTVAEVVPPGTLGVEVSPAARIMVDGVLRGEGTTLRIANLAAGEHSIRFEIPGRPFHEQAVTIEPEQMAVVDYSFPAVEEEKVEEPTIEDEGTADDETEAAVDQPRRNNNRRRNSVTPPKVSFTSSPAGATVVIDGSAVGTTPYTWSGSSGQDARVELRLNGYQTASGTISGLKNGGRSTFDRTLKPAAQDPGTVSVGVIGGGWGHVYIDGKQQAKPAPSRYSVSPGSHEIRIVNKDLGLDYTERVNVTSGASLRVNARP